MVAGTYIATQLGADLHRLELPAKSLGFLPPPSYTELTFRAARKGRIVHALAGRPQAEELARWLRSMGATVIGEGPGKEVALKATFANLPDPVEYALSLVQVERIGLGTDGSAFLVARGARTRVHEVLVELESQRMPENAVPELTARQAELLQFCKDRGYYKIPHTVTLRDLAHDLGISPTALSLALRRAEARILSAYVERLRHNLPSKKPAKRAKRSA